MPCPDQTSLLKLKVSPDDTLVDYTYSKYTCGKPIGIGSGLKTLLAGKPAKTVLSLSPPDAIRRLNLQSDDDRVLLMVEHEAVTAAVGLLYGIETPVTPRYSINRMSQEPDGAEIDIDAAPLPTAPKVPLPCSSFPENTLSQS